MNKKRISTLKLISCFLLFGLIQATTVQAETVCSDDITRRNQLLASGQVVTEVNYIPGLNSQCTYNTEYTFGPLYGDTIVCEPSNRNNLPEGYVIYEQGKSTDAWYSKCGYAGFENTGYKVKRPSTTSPTKICDFSKIPEGFVVDDLWGISYSCGSQGWSQVNPSYSFITIRFPSTSPGVKSLDCISGGRPLPEGYVITDYVRDVKCSGGPQETSGLGRKITIPPGNEDTAVCQGSPVPPGFVMKASGDYPQCNADPTQNGPGFIIGPETTDYPDDIICASRDSDVPWGYVISEILATGPCASPAQNIRVTPALLSRETTACKLQSDTYIIPTGFVLTSSWIRGYPCDAYQIKLPAGSSETICNNSPIPSGWVTTGTATSTRCGYDTNNQVVIEPIGTQDSEIICANTTVPEGYVVTKVTNSWGCNFYQDGAAWLIERPNPTPGNKTTVCKMQEWQIPDGFLVVEKDEYANCATQQSLQSYGNIAYRAALKESYGFAITRPHTDQNTTICSLTNLPTGYGVVNSGSYADCGIASASGPGYIISPVNGAGPYTLCSPVNAVAPIPEGYVITAIDNSNNSDDTCGANSTYIIELPSTTDTSLICADSIIPDDFVLQGINNSTNVCPNNLGWVIAYPSSSENTPVCAIGGAITVPEGYIVAQGSVGNKVYCLNGLGYSLIPDNLAVIPTTFINLEADVSTAPAAPTVTCEVGTPNGGLINSVAKNAAGCN